MGVSPGRHIDRFSRFAIAWLAVVTNAHYTRTRHQTIASVAIYITLFHQKLVDNKKMREKTLK